MTLQTLCTKIGLPCEVTDAVLSCPPLLGEAAVAAKLCDPACHSEGWQSLREAAGPDPFGFRALAVLLRTALRSRERYKEAGISEEVFLDTMKCFTRFVNEYRESYGEYGFDRGFWVGRQLSLLLFRLGELEYERTERDGEPALAIHIPSDANLSPDETERSLALADDFFRARFPAYMHAPMFCNSWLLSPVLHMLLPPSSKILRFQTLFEIVSFDEAAQDYKQWVFKNRDLPPERFPEDTSLQREMKAFVLHGGKVGCALGILKKDAGSPPRPKTRR